MVNTQMASGCICTGRMKGMLQEVRKVTGIRKAASIPVALIDIARAQGIDLLNVPEVRWKFRNNPDNRASRTTLEEV